MAYINIDFSSRIAAIRSVGLALGVSPASLPDSNASPSDVSCLRWINRIRAAKSAPLLPNLDYTGFVKAVNELTGLGPPPFIFPSASLVALYSVRKVGASYAGKCVNVRRTSDNTTTDIGFGTDGFIDMAAAATFAAGSILYVTKWYDQSGAGLDVAQTNTGFQPQLNSIGGRPWLSFVAGGGGSSLQAATVGAASLTGNQTIGVVAQLNSDNGQVPVACTSGSDGWGFFYNGVGGGVGPNPGKNVYWTNGGTVVGTFDMFTKMPTRMVTTRAAGALKIYANGTLGGSGAGLGNGASSAPLKIGQYAGFPLVFEGLIGEVFLYSTALADVDRLAIDVSQAASFPDTGFATPYNGAACVQFGMSEQIAFGNILQFERTQPWTVFAAIQMYGVSAPAIAGGIIFSNVTAPSDPTFPGYELWVDIGGHLRVRLINNATTNNYIGLQGSIYLADGVKHMVAATYDGSSLATGIKMYVDGVLDTGAVSEGPSLTGSIVKAGQAMFVGTQQNENGFNFTGTIGHFQLDNIVRNAAYIAPIFGGIIPPQNANTVWRLALTEDSGTTANDSSGNSRNGTLSSANMWVP